KKGVEQTLAASFRKEHRAKADEPPGRNAELEARSLRSQRVHFGHLTAAFAQGLSHSSDAIFRYVRDDDFIWLVQHTVDLFDHHFRHSDTELVALPTHRLG